jgi:hypothetical protein
MDTLAEELLDAIVDQSVLFEKGQTLETSGYDDDLEMSPPGGRTGVTRVAVAVVHYLEMDRVEPLAEQVLHSLRDGFHGVTPVHSSASEAGEGWEA